MSNNKKCCLGCYLKNLFKIGNLIPMLLLVALAMTGFAINYEYLLFQTLSAREGLYPLLIAAVAMISAVGIVYLICSIKSKTITVADHFGLALVFTAICFLAYSLVKWGDINLKRGITMLIFFVIGFCFILSRGKFFDASAKKEDIIYTKNCMSGYFATIFKKYSFFSIIVTVVVSVSVAYLVFDPAFRSIISPVLYDNPILWYIFGITGIVTALYFAITAFSKRINVSDIALLSTIISMPLVLVQILVKNNGGRNSLTYWAIMVAAILVFAIVRFLRFDITVNTEKKVEGNIVKQFFIKHNILLVLASACLIVCAASIIYKTRILQTTFNLVDGTFDPAPKFILLSVISISVIVFCAWALLSSILNLNSKKVTMADFMLAVITITGILALSFFGFCQKPWILTCIVCGLAGCLVLCVIRIILFNKANAK